MFTVRFWRDAAERAAKTAAQTAVALLGVDGVDLLAVSWSAVLTASGAAALLSVLTSVGSTARADPETASLTTAVTAHRPGTNI